MQKTLLITVAVLLFLPNLFNKDINPALQYDQKENFNPGLSYINSIQKLETYLDSIAAAKKINVTDFEYVELLESIIENRFYHGFSHFTLNENWIAAFAGKYIKEDYACKVQPEKIIMPGNAACSQQALVMMAVLRNKKISYRSIGFPHHYAMEVLIDHNWYFFDANMEPRITKGERLMTNWKHQNDNLKIYYDTNRFTDLDYKFGNGLTATTGIINEVPAGNARMFQATTGILSKIMWCFPLLMMFYRPRLSVRRPFIAFSFQRKTSPVSLSA
jgi:hypothetical protein